MSKTKTSIKDLVLVGRPLTGKLPRAAQNKITCQQCGNLHEGADSF